MSAARKDAPKPPRPRRPRSLAEIYERAAFRLPMLKLAADGRTVVPAENAADWEQAMLARCEGLAVGKDPWRVASDQIGIAHVSTVFLGIEVSTPPRPFETMVFGGRLDGEQQRCSTWEEAERQHAFTVERVRKAAGHRRVD